MSAYSSRVHHGAWFGAVLMGTALAGCLDDGEIAAGARALDRRSRAGDEAQGGSGGLPAEEMARAALAPGAFSRHEGTIVTGGLVTGVAPRGLGAELADTYDGGLRLVPATSPDAFVSLTPRAASASPARLRPDGATVGYEDAQGGVSAAYAARDSRVQVALFVPGAEDAPLLSYHVSAGPAFRGWASDHGIVWGMDRSGHAVLALPEPTVRGADGVVRAGRWIAAGDSLDVELPFDEVLFPAVVTVAWETPTWFPAGGQARPAPRANAAATFYAGDQNCVVLFGGYSIADDTTAQRNDVAVRCEGAWQVGPGGAGIPVTGEAPLPTESASLVYAPIGGQPAAYLFGGRGTGGARDDLWRLTLGGTSPARTATWTKIPKAGPWPPRRFEAGLAFDGTRLILFGGADASGAALGDTWRYDGAGWTQVPCSGTACLPARRAFTPVQIGTKVVAFGGATLVGDEYVWSNKVSSFNGTAWKTENVRPARWPTLSDGTISFDGQLLPTPRGMSWAAATPDGAAILGSGALLEEPAPDEPDPDPVPVTLEKTDVWRLQPIGANLQWVRIPVGDLLPGLRVGGAAALDPVRQETLVVGGGAEVPADNETLPVLNDAAPVAYRRQLNQGSMQVLCHAPDEVSPCESYTLEATVVLADGGPASRARALFSRLSAAEVAWVPVEDQLCDDEPAPGGVFRCEVPASGDLGFAVNLVDTGYTPAGDQCAPEPDGEIPSCNDEGLYMGVLACQLPPTMQDGQVLDCK